MPRNIMDVEEHTHGNGGGGGGGSNGGAKSKKLKQKKVPQRGLGVAQLEKILEEQHKKDSTIQETTVLVPNPVHSSTFCSLPMHFPSKNCVFKPKPVNISEANKSGEKLWSSDHTPESFGPNVNLPNMLKRSEQYQQPSSSSSLVNISSGISSSSSSSVLNYQMEPPSNQNVRSGTYVPFWPEEVKMAGMKRPYPFSQEYPPLPTLNCKFPSGYVGLVSTSQGSASCSNEGSVSLESGNLLKRDFPSGSRTLSVSKQRNVQTRALDGDFLTLAPPTAALPHQHSLTSSARHTQEIFTLDSFTYQGVAEEPTVSSSLSRSAQEPVFSFFPSANVQIGQEGTSKSKCPVEVDLNLKL